MHEGERFVKYPVTRLRRLRSHPQLRELIQEHRLSSKDLVMPFFLKEGLRARAPIASMPGQYQHTIKSLLEEAKRSERLGIPAILLFGIPKRKDQTAKEAYNPKGELQKAIRLIKKECPKLMVIADVCLCEYTSHGHCGHLKKGKIDNDSTLKTLSKIAVSYTEAGADVVAPSDMMDGRIEVIRRALDQKGHEDTVILSYAVKYSSAFYGPFRDAAENTPQLGDRLTYQMDPANSEEALREVELDIKEGADLILVKPGVRYLDVLKKVKEEFRCPVGIYNVSGEYSMVKAAHEKRWLDEKKIVLESLLCMKRAGANFIVTYWAQDAARWLKEEA